MIEEGTPPSPWWYRRRPYLIAAIYGVGFLLSNVSFDGRRALPAAVQWGSRWGDSGVSILFWAGVALAVAGWLVRVSGTAYLRGDVVFAGDVQRDRLIIAGPFRYVRNPLYLGDDLLALGIGLYAAPLGFAIVVIANVLFGVVLAMVSPTTPTARRFRRFCRACGRLPSP
jgi:protein-S-isoprenylcysteine O-methyltransferase Ste14